MARASGRKMTLIVKPWGGKKSTKSASRGRRSHGARKSRKGRY